MDNNTVMYIAVFAAIIAVVALIMIWQVRSSLNQSAAPAPAAAPKKAAPARAAAPKAADNGAVVAAIAAAIVAMGGGEIVSIRPAARSGWTSASRLAGVSGTQQF
ncbi:MAG: OadG family protein [Dialister sp.]|nr:OadG family protein [Dialister sp.]